ncbi:F-box protein At3g07870-like [Aegilops tauschii subsp. strangulata]|uniref:F-box protein At3g07870-like n=1 Tax=Aegilops tauschii subsp. strangulata TaxID=200361 RepID=UPI003CC8C426
MASETPPTRGANGQGCPAIDDDVLYEILLSLPAKTLCRLRAVCRSWRSLLSAPSFIAAHRARQAAPLLVVHGRGQDGSAVDVHILDMASGESIKRVRTQSTRSAVSFLMMLHTPHDLVGRPVLGTADGLRLCVLNPANGTDFALPEADPDKHPHRPSFMLGRASTGDNKVLYIGTSKDNGQQLCKVLTLSGDRQWRDTGCPPAKVKTCHSDGAAAVKGVAYFLSTIDDPPGSNESIMAYNLEKEVWRPAALPIPIPSNKQPSNTIYHSLAELGGCLAILYEHRRAFKELWLLVDPDKVIWSRRCTFTVPYRYQRLSVLVAKPLCLLEDGRILIWMWMTGGHPHAVLCMYDPRTMAYTDVADMSNYMLGGIY